MRVVLDDLDPSSYDGWRGGLLERLMSVRVAAGMPERQARDAVTGFLTFVEGKGDGTSVVRRVRADGDVIGTVWYVRSEPGRAIVGEVAVPAEQAAETVRALGDLLGPDGVTELSLSAFRGDEIADAVVTGLDPQLAATRMQLDLTAPTPEERVRLEPMTAEQFDAYRAISDEGYAQELFDSGAFPTLEAARADASRQFQRLLPEGLDSPGHHLWRAYVDAQEVGLLWIWVEDAWAFIYDIRMNEDLRGRGFGSRTLRAGANASRDLGAEILGLNVFGHNDGARRLYERSGYDTIERFHLIEATPRPDAPRSG